MSTSTVNNTGTGQEKVTGYSYFIALLCMLTYAVSFISRNVWNTAIGSQDTLTSLGITAIQAGAIASAFYVGYVISNLISGFIVDRIGPKLSLAIATLGTAAFTLMIPFANSYGLILMLRVLAGIASGPLFSCVTKMNYGWFDDQRRGVAMGFIMSGPAIGMAVASAALAPVIKASGWQVGFFIAAITCLVVGILVAIFGKERGLALATGKMALSEEEKKSDTAKALKIFMRKNAILTTIMCLCALGAGTGFQTWAINFLVKSAGLELTTAGLVFGLTSALGLFTGTLSGWVSDLLKTRKWIIVISGILTTLCIFGFTMTTNIVLLTVISSLLVLFQAGMGNGVNIMQAEQVKSPQAGKIMGWYNAASQLGSVIFPVLLGAVLTASGSYFWVMATIAAGYFMVVLVALFAKDTYGVKFNN